MRWGEGRFSAAIDCWIFFCFRCFYLYELIFCRYRRFLLFFGYFSSIIMFAVSALFLELRDVSIRTGVGWSHLFVYLFHSLAICGGNIFISSHDYNYYYDHGFRNNVNLYSSIHPSIHPSIHLSIHSPILITM